MKLEILQENLSKALSIASRIVTSHVSLPILSNVLLTTVDGRLKIAATNLETTVTVYVGCKILKEGNYTIPARTFTELVSTLPSGKITLELNEGQLIITSGKFIARLNGIPSVDWPRSFVSGTTTSRSLKLSPSQFISSVSNVVFASTSDEGRPVLTGVLFKFQEDSLTMVATDGFRLSKMDLLLQEKDKVPEIKQIIIPAKALTEVVRIVSEESKKENSGQLSVSFDKGLIIFSIGDISLATRLIEGSFPAFEKIIPASHTIDVSTSSQDLLRAIKAASIFARDNANIIKFKISGSSKEDIKFKIESAAAQTGENENELDAKITGEIEDGLTIAFNFHYLLDLLNVVGDGEILMEISSPLSPGVFRLPGNKNFLHLIMPVRVQV